jgi:hypothetical protein
MWTNEELDKIGVAEELRTASLRQDGTLRKPVIIWSARVGDDLKWLGYAASKLVTKAASLLAEWKKRRLSRPRMQP